MNDLNYPLPVLRLKKLCLTGLLCLAGVYAAPAQAACTLLNGWSNKAGNIAFTPTISVPASTAVGTVLDTKSVTLTPNGQYITCDTVTNFAGAFYGTTSGTAAISPTNVAGVGARITFTNGGTPRGIPFALNNTAAGTYSMTNAIWKIELIKTGPITGGTMATGAYAGYGAGGSFFSTFLNVTGGGHIVPATCSVTDTSITVPMGSVNQSEFGGVGTSAGTRNFSVPLDCAAGTKVSITLTGTPDSSGIPGVLALSPSTGTVAQGVGLQLLHNNVPVTFDAPIDAGTAASAGAYNIPFVARYYRTAAIWPGLANSSATFTMTYN
ncbi:fimbrial protein [Collimonas pratensis]|uniref:Fimbrin-like protein fimI n=1 Tax=Collimonas pratensis TaxID=279113 RepID=A0ABN4MFD9_9BURK|nr:fimbrial protein [Collimonas pratensis]AMP16315.1 putative fimbrin-like protein fimI [Collimonas pratensis]